MKDGEVAGREDYVASFGVFVSWGNSRQLASCGIMKYMVTYVSSIVLLESRKLLPCNNVVTVVRCCGNVPTQQMLN